MKTTLNKIRAYSPCNHSWEKLLTALGKTEADDENLSFKFILETLGIKDAVWCLRALPYLDKCLFCADVAELSLPLFEAKFPKDLKPREWLEAIRRFHRKEITEEEFKKYKAEANAAKAAGRAGVMIEGVVAAYAAYAAVAGDAGATTAYTAYAGAATATHSKSWKEIEALFIKYFC